MPASRATASIDTAWKPARSTIALVASSSCSRRAWAVMRVAGAAAALAVREVTVGLGYRCVSWGNACSTRAANEGVNVSESVDIAIVGSGFSGLGMAIQLKRQGRDDFVILERADEVGGTWWANTYPGCACDVPSHLYSFSFAPNPDWTETYSAQPEIRDYLIRCADQFGVRDQVRFHNELTEARWDAEAQRWQ